MHGEPGFVGLLSIAACVALVARWLKFPYTVALVVAGLLLGLTHVISPPHLTKDLLFSVFLPGLLFEAAFHLNGRKFLQNKITILTLAVPGVAVSVGLTAAILAPLAPRLSMGGLSVTGALVFAALIAATDPIAVVALFRSLGAPKRLTMLVESESLLNDGTSVVVFGLVVAAAMGGSTSIAAGALQFLTVVGMGILVGVVIGFAVSAIIRRIDDPMIEITLTTIAAYGSFILAEELGYSGVIATVVAGMVFGNYGAPKGMTPTTRVAVETFWDYLAFALNSIVFLLIGFAVHISDLVAAWRPILVAWVAVTSARAALVILVSVLLRRTKERMPWSWTAILTWGGLRGGLSMVLALSLPAALADRDTVVTMTFGVVVVSILVQGLTMPWLIRRLGVIEPHDQAHAGDTAHLLAARAAIVALREDAIADEEVRTRLLEWGEARARQAGDAVAEPTRSAAIRAEERRLHTIMLHAEKAAILDALRMGAITDDIGEEQLRAIDGRLVDLHDASHDA